MEGKRSDAITLGAALVVLLLSSALPARATEYELLPTDDAYVATGGGPIADPNTNYGSVNELRFGHESPAIEYRSYLHFPIDEIPSSETIESATLRMRFWGANNPPVTYQVYRAGGSWDESVITWNNQPGYVDLIYVGEAFQPGEWWVEIPLTELVQEWHAPGSVNHGICILGFFAQQLAIVCSKEQSDPDFRPKLIVHCTPGCEDDAYEPDNECSQGHVIVTDGTYQMHNFCQPGDEDWLYFDGEPNGSYTIHTFDLEVNADTYLELYAEDCVTLLAEDDNGGPGLGSQIQWTCPAAGRYNLRVRPADPSHVGADTWYKVQLDCAQQVTVCVEDEFLEPVGTGFTVERMRYDGGQQYVDERETNASGCAQWESIVPDDYLFATYDHRPNAWGGRAFWGTTGVLTINPCTYLTLSWEREEPFIRIEDLYWEPDPVPGMDVTFVVTIANHSDVAKSCKAGIRIDRDQQSPYDFDSGLSEALVVGPNMAETVLFTWHVPQDFPGGTCWLSACAHTLSDGSYRATDLRDWEREFDVPVTVPDPIPQIAYVLEPPSTLELGQPFEIEIQGVNAGGVARWGGFSISFPDAPGNDTYTSNTELLGDHADILVTAYDTDHTEVYPTGSSIFHISGQQIPAEHPVIELWDEEPTGWQPGEIHTIRLSILPKRLDINHFRTRVRLTMLDLDSDNRFTDPASGPLDQQGFPVIEHEVLIVFPPFGLEWMRPQDQDPAAVVGGRVGIAFEAEVHPDHIHGETFRVEAEGQQIAGDYEQISDRQYVFRPDDPLPYQTVVTCTISGDIPGFDGDDDGTAEGSPEDDYMWSFTTQAEHVEDWHAELARYWAPVVFQDVRVATGLESNPLGRYDFITPATFDHDTDGGNNEENAADDLRFALPLLSYVYYDVIETISHYYITYSLFHPRDWGEASCADDQGGDRESPNADGHERKAENAGRNGVSGRDGLRFEHENDLEGTTLVIRKGPEEFGVLRGMGTVCHSNVYFFANADDYSIQDWARDGESLSPEHPRVQWYAGRPCLFVENAGHGIGGIYRAMTPSTTATPYHFGQQYWKFRGDDGVVYLPANHTGYVPREEVESFGGGGGGAREATYQLRRLSLDLWPLRDLPGQMFVDTYPYEPTEGYACGLANLPRSFQGESVLNSANPPWAWDNWDQWTGNNPDDLPRGQWFLDPAYAITKYLEGWEDVNDPGYADYWFHEYQARDNTITITGLGPRTTLTIGEEATIEWDYEISSDPGPGMAELADLYLSTDGGQTWEDEPVNGAVPIYLGDHAYMWVVEAGGPSGECRLALKCPLICSGDPNVNVTGTSESFGLEPSGVDERPQAEVGIMLRVPTLCVERAQVTWRQTKEQLVSARVFDATGRQIRILTEAEWPAGTHTLTWDGREHGAVRAATGIYYLGLDIGERHWHRRFLLLR